MTVRLSPVIVPERDLAPTMGHEVLKLPAPAMSIVEGGEHLAFPDVAVTPGSPQHPGESLPQTEPTTAHEPRTFVSHNPDSHANKYPESDLPPELKSLYESLQKCLELRDKYIKISLQRVGDNPRDYDGSFAGFAHPDAGGVAGLRPDATQEQRDLHPPPESNEAATQQWRIYPKPPPPHWHWTDKQKVASGQASPSDEEEFEFSNCVIPGEHQWTYGLDEEGVYQVYDPSSQEPGMFL